MKIRYGLVLALAILIGATGCASGGGGGGATGADLSQLAGERPRTTDNTRAAQNALESGDEAEDPDQARMHYQQAQAGANAAIAEDGRNPLAHRLAALAAMGLEDYQTAGTHFDHAAELNELYALEDQTVRERKWVDLYQRGAPLVSSGDYADAIKHFEDANAIYGGRPEAMVILSQLHASLGNYDEALEAMDAATAFLNNTDAFATVDSAQAADWTESINELPPIRANVLATAGRFEDAAAAYRELSVADPENLDYVKDLATVLSQMGNDAEALEVYAGLLDRQGLTGSDYYAIGVGFYQANDYAQAVRAFSGAAGVSENDRDALEMWARSLLLAERFEEIPPVAQRWVDLDPFSQNGFTILAQSANQQGDQETAASAINRAGALEVSVDQLQLQRFGNGGALVSGVVVNKTADQGGTATIRFTFYGDSGDPVGTASQTVSLGGTDAAVTFQVEFNSAEYVGGYGYTLNVG